MKDEGQDRRRAQREPLTLKVEYTDASQLLGDYTENISRGGTFVLTRREIPVGTPVKLILSFPGLLKPISMGGIVKWVRGEPAEERGVGVEFDFQDPDTADKLSAVIKRIAVNDPDVVAKSLRVLVVEDNPHVAQLIRDGLAGGSKRELAGKVNFLFTTVNNGREAIEVLSVESFDVLIVDVYMPILDGAQVIEHVRSTPTLKAMPIVALSAGGPGAREKALAAGADFFLDKPMRLADILATMRRVTGMV
ncbi:MAG: TIGR02266 family protein [Deltaproteobacteria bacterium]|nr:TIGR02266 family protein [Deltaproteobacteria bacterium]